VVLSVAMPVGLSRPVSRFEAVYAGGVAVHGAVQVRFTILLLALSAT
jgi:hypothetical protein